MLEVSSELVLVAVITLLAVISPGPDFAITTRNSLLYGRKSGIATAMGIASGISVHVAYISLGLGYLISQSVWVLEGIRYAGAAYLIYLGISSFRVNKQDNLFDSQSKMGVKSNYLAFISGFLSNVLNPKTALFFISLFTQIVSVDTSLSTLIMIGLFIATAHYIWFSLVALFLTSRKFKELFNQFKVHIERFIGVCLIGLGAQLALGK